MVITLDFDYMITFQQPRFEPGMDLILSPIRHFWILKLDQSDQEIAAPPQNSDGDPNAPPPSGIPWNYFGMFHRNSLRHFVNGRLLFETQDSSSFFMP